MALITSVPADTQTQTQVKENAIIWISPVGKQQGEQSAVNPAGGSRAYSIQFDDGKIYPAEQDKSILVPNIEMQKRHLVKVRLDGKMYTSFWFSFEREGTNELCLWFNDFYHTWSIWPLKDAKHLCRSRIAG